MNPRILGLCLAGALASSPVAADKAQDASAKENEIRRLLELTGASKLGKQMMDEMRTNMRPLIVKALPPGAYREKLVTLFFEKFQSKMGEQTVVDLAVPLYDKYFTLEEIKGLVAFYRTPLGHKSVEVVPKLMAEAMQQGNAHGQKVGRACMEEVLEEHPELKAELEAAAKRTKDQ